MAKEASPRAGDPKDDNQPESPHPDNQEAYPWPDDEPEELAAFWDQVCPYCGDTYRYHSYVGCP